MRALGANAFATRTESDEPNRMMNLHDVAAHLRSPRPRTRHLLPGVLLIRYLQGEVFAEHSRRNQMEKMGFCHSCGRSECIQNIRCGDRILLVPVK